MAGYEVRGGSALGQWKWPLYTLWSLADLRGDRATTLRVGIVAAMIANGRRYYRDEVEQIERYVAWYLHGHQ